MCFILNIREVKFGSFLLIWTITLSINKDLQFNSIFNSLV